MVVYIEGDFSSMYRANGLRGGSGGSRSLRYMRTSASDGTALSSRKRLGSRQAQQALRFRT